LSADVVSEPVQRKKANKEIRNLGKQGNEGMREGQRKGRRDGERERGREREREGRKQQR
jgi:hypothetical protein